MRSGSMAWLLPGSSDSLNWKQTPSLEAEALGLGSPSAATRPKVLRGGSVLCPKLTGADFERRLPQLQAMVS